MASQVGSLLGWWFLPDFVANNLQSFYYSVAIRAGDPRPVPGSPRFVRDRARIHILVLAVYLAYTLFEAHWEVRRDGDFYALLGVPHSVDAKALNSRFRKLTLMYHPDKIVNAEQRAGAERTFILLQTAKDTLLDPTRRFAYDRFGPDVTTWTQCKTIRDFLVTGLPNSLPFYIGSGITMFILSRAGFLNWGTYWRYLALASLATFELYVLTRPSYGLPSLPWLWGLVPQTSLLAKWQPQMYLPFQVLRIARSALLTLFIALSRLGPLLDNLIHGPSGPASNAEEGLSRALQRIEQLVAANGMEAARLLALDLAPYKADEGASIVSLREKQAQSQDLEKQIKDWLITNTIRSDPEVRKAVEKVLAKRNQRGHVEELSDDAEETSTLDTSTLDS